MADVLRTGTLQEITDAIDTDLKLLASGGEVHRQADFFAALLEVIAKFPTALRVKAIELVANLARQEEERIVAAKAGALLPMLDWVEDNSLDVQFQSLRAIGNLCYEHDDSRAVFLGSNGCERLGTVLKKYSELSVTEEHERHKCVVCGCLSNTCSDQNDSIGKEYVRLGVHTDIIAILSAAGETPNVITLSLQALSALVSSDASLIESLTDTKLPAVFTSLLAQCGTEEGPPYIEPLIDMLSTFLEKDKWKLAMAESSNVEFLLSVKDAEFKQKSIDLVVLMLTGDESMAKISKGGVLLSKAIEWMKNDDSDISLKATAALIVANMARNDANCIHLIQSGVAKHLIKLTELGLSDQEAAKVYHGALSALRNLALPAETKSLLFEQGVVDAAIRLLLHSTMSMVQFKALGTLRLLTQKQAPICAHITQSDGIVEKIVDLCADSSTGGHLTAEGCRLLSALVKYSQNVEDLKKIADAGGCKWIVTLLQSEHNVMINEGLIAISVLVAINSAEITTLLLDCDLLKIVHNLLENDKATATPEILFNLVSLLETLIKTGHRLDSQPNLKESIEKLCTHSNDAVKSKAISIISKF